MDSLPELHRTSSGATNASLGKDLSDWDSIQHAQPQQNLSSATSVQTYINNTTILCMH